jgi:NitT/TauT family transport system substrate-binding protein
MPTRSRALGLLGACAAIPSALLAQTPATIRIGSVAADAYAEPFYGSDMGFFKNAGIDAAVTAFSSSGAAAAACAGGAIDVALTDISVIANAANRGVSFAAFAGGGLYGPRSSTTALCAPRNSPYRQAKDFEGQSIAVVTLVSVSSVAVKAWLEKNGADINKVKIVEMPFPEMGPALSRGAVQAAFIAEPSLSQIPPDVAVIADPYGAIAKTFFICTWYSTRDWLSKNSDLAKRLAGAVYETARWANRHRDLSAPILGKYSKLPLSAIRQMRRSEYGTSLTAALLQPVLDAGFAYKAIPRQVDAASLMVNVS